MSPLLTPGRAKRNFTDIYSYLNVRYGLVWTDLKDLEVPLRVGDVVILPGELITIQSSRHLLSVTGFSPGVGNFGAQSESRISFALFLLCED